MMNDELEALDRLYKNVCDEFEYYKNKECDNDYKIVKQALLKAQENEICKFYKVMIRQYSIMKNDTLCYVKFIKTNDIYHWIGKYYSSALERVDRIDYQEITKEKYEEGKDITYYKGEII